MFIRLLIALVIAVGLGILVQYFPGVVSLRIGDYFIQMHWLTLVLLIVVAIFALWSVVYLIHLPFKWTKGVRHHFHRKQIRDKNELIESFLGGKDELDFKRHLNTQDHGIQAMMWSRLSGSELVESLNYAKPPFSESYYYYQVMQADRKSDQAGVETFLGRGLDNYPTSRVLNDFKIKQMSNVDDVLDYVKKVGTQYFSEQVLVQFSLTAIARTTNLVALEALCDHLPKMLKSNQAVQWTYVMRLQHFGESKKARKFAFKIKNWSVQQIQQYMEVFTELGDFEAFYHHFVKQFEVNHYLIMYKFALLRNSKLVADIALELTTEKSLFTSTQQIDWCALEVQRYEQLRQFEEAKKMRHQLEKLVFEGVGMNA